MSTITYQEYVDPYAFQRIGTSAAVPITGSYTGSPTSIEARAVLDGTSTEAVGWTTIVASPSGSPFLGNLTVPQGGWYNLQVRFGNDHSVVSNGTGKIGVGALYAYAGQSQAANVFAVGSGTPNALTRKFSGSNPATGWATVTGVGAITFANAMRAALGIPIIVLDYGIGSTALLAEADLGPGYWLNTAGGSPYDLFKAGVNSIGGKLEGVIWMQGENEVIHGSTQANYVAGFRTLATQIRSDFGQASLPIFIQPVGRFTGETDATAQTIRDALRQVAGDSNNYLSAETYDLPLSDSVHFDATGQTMLNTRIALRAQEVLGVTTNSRGPYVLNCARVNSTTIDVRMALRGGTTVTPASSITGFSVVDNGAPATISSVTRVSATIIRIVVSSPLVGITYVRYMYGHNPTISAPVYDDSANALPLVQLTTAGVQVATLLYDPAIFDGPRLYDTGETPAGSVVVWRRDFFDPASRVGSRAVGVF